MSKWALVVATSAFIARFCNFEEKVEDTVLKDLLESALVAIADATYDLNNSGSGFNISSRPGPLVHPGSSNSLLPEVFDLLFPPLRAACATAGSVVLSPQPQGWGSEEFIVEKSYTDCGNGSYSTNGSSEIRFDGMATVSPYVQADSVVERAVNLEATNVSGRRITLKGYGAILTGGSRAITSSLKYIDVPGLSRTIEITLSSTREAFSESGALQFSHTISTPTVVTMFVENYNNVPPVFRRGINTGTISVSDAVSGVNLDVVFDFQTNPKVYYNPLACGPYTGVATATISGSKSGSGTLTFGTAAGRVVYDLGGAGNGELQLPGCL